jgi:hypothetical protein
VILLLEDASMIKFLLAIFYSFPALDVVPPL